MTRVFRFDQGQLAPPKRRPNGWLEAEGKLARVGIQEYEQPDGTMTRELRLPEEVFSKATMDSFHLVPVTATHPPVLLDDKNAPMFSKGSVGQVRQDGDWLVGPLMVTDGQTVARVESGELPELSTGYSCELETGPDIQDATLTAKWGQYDAIQRKILANHEALVQSARAGPDARMRLDSTGNALAAPAIARQGVRAMTTTVRIDGLTYEMTDANSGVITQAIQQAIERAAKIEKDRADAATTRADEAGKKFRIVRDNGRRLIKRTKALHAAFDAVKARMIDCDECDGTGKVPDDTDPAKSQKCDFCDGAGKIRMQTPIAEGDDAPDGDSPDADPDDVVGDPDDEMDEDELETEQETENEAGAAAKGDARKRADARKKRRLDAKANAEKRRASMRRRIDRGVRARVALEGTARRFLDAGTDLSKLDAAGIRKAVIEKLSPKVKLDGLTPERIAEKFDTLVEAAGEGAGNTANASDILRAGSGPFIVPQHADQAEEKEDGSHLSGRARMLWNLEHPTPAAGAAK